jgi:hypothetical protein
MTTVSYSEGPAETIGDVSLRQRFYTQAADAGELVGKTLNVMFTLDRPAAEVWPHFKDLNLWQNAYGHYYSGVIGDLEGETFRLSDKPDDGGPHQYRMVRVISEHVMVMSQLGDWEGASRRTTDTTCSRSTRTVSRRSPPPSCSTPAW